MILNVKRLIFMKVQKYYMYGYRDFDEILDSPTHPRKWNILSCKVISTSVWCSQMKSSEVQRHHMVKTNNFGAICLVYITVLYRRTSPGRDGGQTE